MTTLARYVPEDRVLDLSKLALVDYRLVADLHGKIERGQRLLLCLETGGDPELYIRKSGGKYWACHYPGGAHGRHEVALMSDEHRRATDYIVRAADDAGYRTATEVTTSNRTRLDAVIFGNRVAGAEVQWSHIGTPDARTRTTKSLRATALVGTAAQDLAEGVLPVWFSPSGGRPDWLYRVPTVEAPTASWAFLPRRRAVMAAGVREVLIERCRPGGPFQNCPKRKKNFCGGFHPWARVRTNDETKGALTLDDVFTMVPGRRLVPINYHDYVYLVDAESAAKYKEFTTMPGSLTPKRPPKRRSLGPVTQSPRECISAAHSRATPMQTEAGATMLRHRAHNRPGRAPTATRQSRAPAESSAQSAKPRSRSRSGSRHRDGSFAD